MAAHFNHMSDSSSTPGSDAPSGGDAKPAFKVTRSPFAPKSGATPVAAPTGPMSIGAADTLAAAAAKAPGVANRPMAPMTFKPKGEQTSTPMFVIDLLAAGVSVACAVLLALKYFS
jgi:hypothetical protein